MKLFSKINVFVLLAVLVLVFSFSGCRKGVQALPDVTVGSTFEIKLASYDSTPYKWEYEITPSNGIEYLSMDFIPESKDPSHVGGGDLVYTFKAVKVGEYQIEFSLKHLTDKASSPKEVAIYSIKVN